MKILLLTLLTVITLFAQVRVATTYAYLGKITQRIGGDLVKVDVLANPKLDPHFITPKPSLIAKLRREDLLIINGGQLEIGWLPPLLKSANNAKIHSGQKGFLDVSGVIDMIDKPSSVSRTFGDVHPDGNPHFALDVNVVLPIAQLISMKLAQIDPQNATSYSTNYNRFKSEFRLFIQKIDKMMLSCTNKKVVQYHKLFDYALNSYDIKSIGTIEPLPGISPSSKHTIELIAMMKSAHVKTILQDVYHEKRSAKFIATKTGANVSIIPHDVGAVDGTDTLESFYSTIAKRLCQ